jgi:hypothetical protein
VINLFNALVGLVTPVGKSAAPFLRQKLRDFGVSDTNVPDGCVKELAAQMVATAQKITRIAGGNIRDRVVVQIEGEAALIADMLKTREQRYVQDTVGPDFRKRIGAILVGHGVEVPPP